MYVLGDVSTILTSCHFCSNLAFDMGGAILLDQSYARIYDI